MKKILSNLDTATVLANIRQILADKKIKLFAVYDHSLEAKQVGLNLPTTQVLVFGDPKIGTFLMQEDNSVALDLPLKLLVWEENGKTGIAYHLPSSLGKSFNLEKHQVILEKMDLLLIDIVKMAIQKDE